MGSKHQTAEYQRNAVLLRKRVKAIHASGEPWPCWRCRGPINPGQPFDIGHRDPAGGSGFDNLAPEHRHRTTHCQGNRANGGTIGAGIVNARRSPQRQQGEVSTWRI